jgi:hypothetical protein
VNGLSGGGRDGGVRDAVEGETVEWALRYLGHPVEDSGDDPKPVGRHGTRRDGPLRQGDRRDVGAGFPHDPIEDTDVTAGVIRSRVGEAVTATVAAVNYDERVGE